MPRMLKETLKDILTIDEITKIYSSFDIIGDIIIIKIPDSLLSKKEIIANTLLKKIKSVNTVFQQISPVQGDYRLRQLEFLAGEEKTITEYKEHGCIFKVDVSKTYFSTRLSTRFPQEGCILPGDGGEPRLTKLPKKILTGSFTG